MDHQIPGTQQVADHGYVGGMAADQNDAVFDLVLIG